MHLTLDGWRPNRDTEMWALPKSEWGETLSTTHQAPALVTPAPRLADDLEVLLHLFRPEHPPVRLIRPKRPWVVVYCFANASSTGFGSSLLFPDGDVHFRYGIWGLDEDSLSSYFRELGNVVEALESGVAQGRLLHTEVFLYTNNTTAERAYYKGNSPSQHLFELVRWLRTLEFNACLTLHMVHVAGTRMIAQGTDGLSRGLLTEGVFSGLRAGWSVPLHQSAIDVCPALLDWLHSWLPEPILPLTPIEWYHWSWRAAPHH